MYKCIYKIRIVNLASVCAECQDVGTKSASLVCDKTLPPNYDFAIIAVEQTPDLALIKRVGTPTDSELIPGGTVTFDITVFNQGTLNAYNVQISDYLPDG